MSVQIRCLDKHVNTNNLKLILEDIKKDAVKKKRDKFTKKFGLVVCNQNYDKTGLPDLPQTKKDFSNIKDIAKKMGIKKENLFELINAGHD